MELNERLKKLREEKGYSVEELASLIELTPADITAWEDKTSAPDARALMKLSKAYGMSIDSIVYEDNSVPEYDESKAVYASAKEEIINNPPKQTDSKKEKKQKKKMTVSEWMTIFVFPVFCALVYLCLGITMKVWHPTWLVLVLIPIYFFLYFLLRGIGNSVDSAVEDYITESEKEENENNH